MSHFVPENSELVSIKYKDNTKDFTLFSKKKDITFDKPIVILVNNFSASASEILA
jgi:C-terminal processing protease CtpA/Prc